MTLLQAATTLLPYHLLSYGALLGSELYQTFINTKICFRALPMREFLVLQKCLFPAYFRTQLGLVALTAATRPPAGIGSFVRHVSDAVPLVIIATTGGLNEWVFGPRTTRDAFVRSAVHESATESGTKETEKVNKADRAFARNHAMSIHLNAISVVATIWYAFSLTSSLLADSPAV
ncbi:hypothetical protein PHISP_00336 [Aspergillus sp. HF37]|nr:hypothetical protein PHISP_00336 [Aspergillus sp. HF37]